ncbi:MAG: cytochrome c oxidase assembly protein [Bauldia sp.]|nr:cytochrome c oxidase assembly protein [Bauldia sp.]
MAEDLHAPSAEARRKRSQLIAGACVAFVFGMVALAYASVPLYALFCQLTGFGGTPQRAEGASDQIIDRMITVRFDANVAPGLGWDFEPEVRQVRMRMGEIAQIAFRAENLTDVQTTGTATFNVTPPQVGGYFNKISCFCFNEQVLQPGESAELPVVLFVDAAMDDESSLKYVDTITLSYTFFPLPNRPLTTAAATGLN